MSHTTSDLNPKFVFFSPVRTGAASAEELIEQVDHAIIALDARAPLGGSFTIEPLNAVPAAAVLRVDLWVKELDTYACTYGFMLSSENGTIAYARGERSMVNGDAKPWPAEFRATHTELMKDLPAFA